MLMTANQEVSLLKNEGRLVQVGCDYMTDTGVLIERVLVGRRGTTQKWLRADERFLYRCLLDAYHKVKF